MGRLSLQAHRRWTSQHLVAAQKQFDAFARSMEAPYRTTAISLFSRMRNDALSLLSLTVEDDGKSLRAPPGPLPRDLSHVSDYKVDRLLRAWRVELDLQAKGITEQSVRDYIARLDVLEREYAQQWLERLIVLNNTTAGVVLEEVNGTFGINASVFDPLVNAEIMGRANLLAGRVSASTFNAIRNEVFVSLNNGESTQLLGNRIEKVFGQGYSRMINGRRVQILSAPQRALLIARTETTAVTNGASLRGIQGSDLDKWKLWASQGDDRVRDAHLQEESDSAPDGIPLDEVFPVTGLDYPQEPNCRCTMLYIDPPKDAVRKPPAEGATPAQEAELKKWRDITPAHAKEVGTRLSAVTRRADNLTESIGMALGEVRNSLTFGQSLPRKVYDKMRIRERTLMARIVKINRALQMERARLLRPPGARRGLQKLTWQKTAGIKNTAPAKAWVEEAIHPSVLRTRKQVRFGDVAKVTGDSATTRAFYRASEKLVAVHPSAEVRTIVHEFGHALEHAAPRVMSASQEFLQTRAATHYGVDLSKIKKRFWTETLSPYLEPVSARGELGWKGGFATDYTGRAYHVHSATGTGRPWGPLRSSEILSTGLEAMYSNPMTLALRDPEHFLYVLRFMNANHLTDAQITKHWGEMVY